MKRIMIACLGLSLLSGTAVFAQNTSDTTGSTMKSKTKHKKNKKGETTSSGSTTSTSTSR